MLARRGVLARRYGLGGTFGDDQGDVVVLLVRGEGANVCDHGSEEGLRTEFSVTAERLDQAIFAEFFGRVVHGFGYAVGVEGQ